MADNLIQYIKSLNGEPTNYRLQIKYGKSVTVVDLADIELAIEKYTIESDIAVDDIVLTISHVVTGFDIAVNYTLVMGAILSESGTLGTFSFGELSKMIILDLDIEKIQNGINLDFGFTDSEGTRTIKESSGLITMAKFLNPTAKIEIEATNTVAGSFRQIYYDIEYFNIARTYATWDDEDQSVGDYIYPKSTLLDSVSAHDGPFQNGEIIEAAKIKNNLFVATGSKLLALRYVTSPDDGKVYLLAQEVDKYAHEPTTQQSVIGGLNLLKENPFLSLLDTEGSYSWNPDEIRFRDQFGVAGDNNALRGALTIEAGKEVSDYEFMWEYQQADADDLSVWTEHQAWTAGENGRSINLKLLKPAKYNIKLSMRVTASPTTVKTKYLFNYEVNSMDKNIEYNVDDTNNQINKCKKIIQFYNKLILYDNNTPNIYKSFSGKETWFTLSGIIPFNNLRQENLEKIITLDDALLGFTKNSITALIGKGDDISYEGYPYEPFVSFVNIDENIGAIAPESVVKLADGSVVFLSNSGLRLVNDYDFSSKKSRSVAIDNNIANVINRDEDACGVAYNNVYYLTIPSKKRMFKWHYNFEGIYSMDESSKLDFVKLYNFDGRLIGINAQEQILRKQVIVNTTFKTLSELEYSGQGYFADDGEIYDAQIGTKDLGFEYDANLKRMFMLFIGFNSVIDEQIKLYINLYADDTTLINVLDNDDRVAEDAEGFDIFDIETISQNAEGDLGIFLGDWELGQQALGFVETTYRHYNIAETRGGYRARVVISHQQDAPVQLFHLGFVYQLGYIPRDK